MGNDDTRARVVRKGACAGERRTLVLLLTMVRELLRAPRARSVTMGAEHGQGLSLRSAPSGVTLALQVSVEPLQDAVDNVLLMGQRPVGIVVSFVRVDDVLNLPSERAQTDEHLGALSW